MLYSEYGAFVASARLQTGETLAEGSASAADMHVCLFVSRMHALPAV